jgi:hypothetical protein
MNDRPSNAALHFWRAGMLRALTFGVAALGAGAAIPLTAQEAPDVEPRRPASEVSEVNRNAEPPAIDRSGPELLPPPIDADDGRAETAGAAPARVAPSGFDAFAIITQRNIFDPNRARGISRRDRNEGEEAPTPRAEAFALVGTLSYDEGRYAYFDGSSSEYRKVLKPRDSIAGYTLAEVGASSVTLMGKGDPVELPIGMEMRRTGQGGTWQVTERSESSFAGGEIRRSSQERAAGEFGDRERSRDNSRNERDRRDREESSRSRSGFGGGASSYSNRSRSSGSGGEDEAAILKALMEKREQELSNEK